MRNSLYNKLTGFTHPDLSRRTSHKLSAKLRSFSLSRLILIPLLRASEECRRNARRWNSLSSEIGQLRAVRRANDSQLDTRIWMTATQNYSQMTPSFVFATLIEELEVGHSVVGRMDGEQAQAGRHDLGTLRPL